MSKSFFMFQRPHLQQLRERTAEPRKRIQVLIGPRQTGKTTLVTQLLEAWKGLKLFVSADAVSGADCTWVQQQWDLARIEAGREDQELLLVIDEVQKVGQWSKWVKKQWNQDKSLVQPKLFYIHQIAIKPFFFSYSLHWHF